ncbi:MAG TPA: hypothetical protein PK308_10485 [Phycisphaerales bacterium]|nr:hypothetical protein [Phycisphaerales bacterium]
MGQLEGDGVERSGSQAPRQLNHLFDRGDRTMAKKTAKKSKKKAGKKKSKKK